MNYRDYCECGRVLQDNTMAEIYGLCDRCRENPAPVAVEDTGHRIKKERKRLSLLGFLRAADPETCPCYECSTARDENIYKDLY